MNPGMYTSDDDAWATPQDIFDKLNKLFGPFDLDPAASSSNAKCEKYYTRLDSGLRASWYGHSVFLNPPYGRDIHRWMRKCSMERFSCKVIVALIPGRTDARWFQEYVLSHVSELYFVRGRIKFEGSFNSAPFPSIIAVYHPVQFASYDINGIKINSLDFKKIQL